jgi:hypothetical protein
MRISIYFLFHKQNVVGIFHFVIVWRRQFDCDIVCNVTVWRSFNFLLHLFSLHKRHRILLNQRWRQNNVFYHHCSQFQRTGCCFLCVRWMNGWPSDLPHLHSYENRTESSYRYYETVLWMREKRCCVTKYINTCT